MQPPEIDLTNPVTVYKELLDDDRWIKDEFSTHLSVELLKLSETLADSFRHFPRIDKLAADGDEQAAFVAGFVFGVFDDLIVSAKLLVAGKITASGNLMRQAIEGIAVAILCASRQPLSITKGAGKGKHSVKINYWQKLKARDSETYAHKAIGQLESNCDFLGIRRSAINRLKAAKKRYDSYSHPSQLGMACRMSMGEQGTTYIGGSFDEAKLPAYRIEIAERIGLCGLLPNLIDGLIQTLGQKEQ